MLKDNSINSSQALSNGIIHASRIIPSVYSKTYRDEDGNIKSVIYPQLLDSIFNSEFIEIANKLNVNMLVFMAFNTSLLLISAFFLDARFTTSMLFFCIFVSHELVIFIKSSYYMNFHCKSMGRYHSAEHMANNAYRSLGRIPTMKEIKHFSRFSKYCGSMKTINYLVFALLGVLIILFFRGLTLLISSLLLFFFYILATKFQIFRFLQVFYTIKPTDAELELAIESLKNYRQMEDDIQNGKIKGFSVNINLDDFC